MDHFESFNLITIRKKKNVGRTPGSKRWNLTTKSSSLEHLEPRISCVWWNFLENGQGSFPFVPNHTQPWSDSGSLTYLRARKRRFSDSMARLTFSTQKIHRRNPYGEPFLRRKMLPCDRAPSSYCTQHCHEVSAQSSTKNWMPIRTKVRMKYIFLAWSFNAETFSHSVKILRYI